MNFLNNAVAAIKGWPWGSLVVQAIYQVLLLITWQYKAAGSWVLFFFILLVTAWVAVNVLGIFGLKVTGTEPGRPIKENPPKPPTTL